MLFAELHRKLNEDSPALQRREDILTSTVFGTLIVSGRSDILRRWLGRAVSLDGSRLELSHDGPIDGYWFWPRLPHCEPDLLVKLDGNLCIIEAKYGATKGGAGSEPERVDDEEEELVRPRDQLAREWLACDTSAAQYVKRDDLAEAITTSQRRLIYLVRRQKLGKARREIRESVEVLADPGAAGSFFLLTWQDLHREICLMKRHATSREEAWVDALGLLLERRDLAAFSGFRGMWPEWTKARATVRTLSTLWPTKKSHGPLSRWRRRARQSFASGILDLPETMSGIDRRLACLLAQHDLLAPAQGGKDE